MVNHFPQEFVGDYYIEIWQDKMENICQRLENAGVLFICEPWPNGHWRVYVGKDGKRQLDLINEEIELSKKRSG